MSGQTAIRWWASPRMLLRQLLMLDDTPHAIALGTAVGMFIGMTPTVGLQMLVVMIFAFLTRPLFYFNRMAALITVYISNPVTMVPIYWFDYQIGSLFIVGEVTRDDFARLMAYQGLEQWWQTLVWLCVEVGAPMLIGSLVLGTITAAITYPCMRWLVQSFHGPSPAARITDREPVGTAAE